MPILWSVTQGKYTEKKRGVDVTPKEAIRRVQEAFSPDFPGIRDIELTSIILELPAEDRKPVESLIKLLKKADAEADNLYRSESIAAQNPVKLAQTDKGLNKSTIENFRRIMLEDEFYSGMYFNILRNHAEIHKDGKIKPWTDANEAESMRYIEETYNLYDPAKHTAALRLAWSAREYNPVTEIIDGLKWDGVERCEHFLTKWGMAADDEYTRECSRLIFADGIHRLYEPGCKADDVVVLIGKQGAGKSTLVRFLAINDSYYGEIKTVEGDKAVEQLEGVWICEIAELFAVTKHKEQEAVKAFITRQRDKYRKPYDKNPKEYPRSCILIGTSNEDSFLIDKTGNRRWFPVSVHCDGYDLFNKEQEARDYVLQCWAEAKAKLGTPAMQNFAKRELVDQYRQHQDAAMQDDWRVGAIGEYLKSKNPGDYVCAREIMHEALSPDSEHKKDPTLQDSKIIGQIMRQEFPEWERMNKSVYLGDYGRQRCWRLKRGYDFNEEDLPL